MRELLVFSASWCGPCRQLKPNVEQASTQVNVRTFDVDNDGGLSSDFSVKSVPTLILVENGVELKRTVGVKTVDQIVEFYNK